MSAMFGIDATALRLGTLRVYTLFISQPQGGCANFFNSRTPQPRWGWYLWAC